MNKGKTILIWLLIVLLLGVIGFCGYRVVDKLNGNTSEENNVEEKKEEKKETDATSKATEKADKTDATSGATKQADSESSELVKKFKDKIFSSNEKLLADTKTPYSKLTDFDILKIEETTKNGQTDSYTIEAKYLCENKSWNCVYYSQVTDEVVNSKDNEGYYKNTFYYFVDERYGSEFPIISQFPAGTGPTLDDSTYATKVVYEK